MKQAVALNIRLKNDDVKIYTVKWRNSQGGEELQLKSCEYPRPELEGTLEDFAQFIPIITCIPQEKIEWILIAGATYVYNDKTGAVGLSLGVALKLRNGYQLEFKTPAKRLDFENPDLETSNMWQDRFDRLALMLQDEIVYYAEGKRAQTELNFSGADADPSEDEEERPVE